MCSSARRELDRDGRPICTAHGVVATPRPESGRTCRPHPGAGKRQPRASSRPGRWPLRRWLPSDPLSYQTTYRSHRLGHGCFERPFCGYNPAVTERSHKPLNSLEQARRIAGLADSKLAEEIVILDMRPVCAYTDFFVICSGGNARQTKSIVDEVRYVLKQDDEPVLPHSVDGEREGDWIVADYLDVVLHVFTPETRKYYGLEELWDDVPSIEHATAG
ncbi:MAG TPA: ribosome silencing factor [Gaiellaceae bacterium]|nr:ribosome silencing factor [Gaiellaceae bacterium]